MIKELYFSFKSILLWKLRLVFLGIVMAYFFNEYAYGEYVVNDMSEFFVMVTLSGLLIFEIILIYSYYKTINTNLLYADKILPALVIFIISIIASLILFNLKGVPALSDDPMIRSQLGDGVGVYKRLTDTFLVLSSFHIIGYSIRYSRYRLIAFFAFAFTILVLFGITFKSNLLFYIIDSFILYKLISRNKNEINTIYVNLLFYIFILIIIYLFSIFVMIKENSENFFFVILMRLTTMLAKAPSYIVAGQYGVPDAYSIIHDDVAGILETLRLPLLVKFSNYSTYDTYLTNIILNRKIDFGGLNWTLIGYGWSIFGFFGVLLFSLFYGFIAGKLYKKINHSTSIFSLTIYMYCIQLIFNAMQIYSPFATFGDIGLSMLLYIMFFKIINRITL